MATMSLNDYFNKRALAGYVFISGNLTLLAGTMESDSVSWNVSKVMTSALLLTASAIYPLTQKRPGLFAAAGGCVITAQGIIAATARGAGKAVQQMGTILPALQGILMIRKAWNSRRGNVHYKTDNTILKPLEYVDRRPILTGALIEGPGVATIAVGAALSRDWVLCAAASQWVLANVFLGASDIDDQAPNNDPSNEITVAP